MAFHVGDLLGMEASVGNRSGWSAGNSEAQGSVTDLSPHVDGGTPTGSTMTNAGADTTVLHWAAGIVIVSGLLLWFLGGVVFKSVRL